MNLTAIALYALGVPLAGLVANASLSEPANSRRNLLGLPPKEKTINDMVAIIVAALVWPALGLVCYASIIAPRRKRP